MPRVGSLTVLACANRWICAEEYKALTLPKPFLKENLERRDCCLGLWSEVALDQMPLYEGEEQFLSYGVFQPVAKGNEVFPLIFWV